MPATMSLSQVFKSFPDFDPGWRLILNGVRCPRNTTWKFVHPDYGSVSPAVVMGADGKPAFQRPRYRENPFGQAVVYGRRSDGKTLLGFIAQERPHADWPGEDCYNQLNRPPVFLTCAMGFKDVVQGKIESDLDMANREASEEMIGDEASVLSEWVHPTGHIPSPTYTSTWGTAAALEVDLSSVVEPDHDPCEPIAGRYWLTVREYKDALAHGTFELSDGRIAYLAADFSNGPISMFLAAHPEIEREAFE